MSAEQAAKIKRQKGITPTKFEEIRIKNNLSQSELSALSGVPLRTIQCYEQKINSVENTKLNTLLNLCIALNCKLENIIEDAETLQMLKIVCSNNCDDDNIVEREYQNIFESRKQLFIKYFDNSGLTELSEDQIAGIDFLIKDFPNDWKEILKLRYIDELTLSQIGVIKGVSSQRIQQILSKTLEKLNGFESSEYVILGYKAYQEKKAYERKTVCLFDLSIEELNLSRRAYNCLMRGNLKTIGEVMLSKDELKNIKSMGKNSVEEVSAKLEEYLEKFYSGEQI